MVVEERLQVARWKDYLALTKPRVVLLHIITATAAMFLAARGLPPLHLLLFTLTGGGMVAGAANALNCYLDRDIDGIMLRTRGRPLPSARLKPSQALIFSAMVGLTGLLILSRLVNLMTSFLALSAMVYYILVYTIWLKRRTHWSSLIGSGAGAFPPLIGWLAMASHLELTPFLLFFIVVLWTPPHFWSLAICHQLDYRQVGIRPVPARNTSLYILLASLGLVAVSLWLVPLAGLGVLYLTFALCLGLRLLMLALGLLRRETPDRARRLFRYSILYLVVLFGAMLADRVLNWLI